MTMMKSLVLAATLALAAESAGAQVAKQPDTAEPALGEPLYAKSCAVCHGAKLEGQADWRSPDANGQLPAPPHDETGHTWHHGDALLFDYTKLGGQVTLQRMGVEGYASGMPAFGETLSDEEIWNILAFIKSTWPDRMRDLQEARSEAEQMRGN